MKKVYPIIIAETTDDKIPFLVYVPDFDAMTQGANLSDAIDMAEDLICSVAYEIERKKQILPEPSKLKDIDVKSSPWAGEKKAAVTEEITTLIPVDFDLYKQKMSQMSVRRNVSLPAWLDAEATKANLNVSALLQDALKERLNKNTLHI